MPASSISGIISTSVYFLAVLLLMALIMVPVSAVYRSAGSEAAGTLANAVASQIDTLSPGMTTVVQFGSYPGAAASVGLSGSAVTATVDGFSSSQTVRWPLPVSQLSPGESYTLSLTDGVVAVA